MGREAGDVCDMVREARDVCQALTTGAEAAPLNRRICDDAKDGLVGGRPGQHGPVALRRAAVICGLLLKRGRRLLHILQKIWPCRVTPSQTLMPSTEFVFLQSV